jgi:hypothetical protein
MHRDPAVASLHLQNHITLLHNWFAMCKIRVNPTKSSHVTFTMRLVTYPPVFLHNTAIQVEYDVKYLGLHLDSKLTWRKHIQTNRQHLNLKLRAMPWLLCRRSQLSLPNKLLLYKCILKPVWTYGIQCGAVRSPLTRKSSNAFSPKSYALLPTLPGTSPTSNYIPT